MKKTPIVQTPVGYVCIPLNEIIHTHTEISHLCRSNSDMENELRRLSAQNDELTEKLAEAEKKLSDTEEELSRENDGKLLWYRKYMDLYDKVEREKVATDAATEAS